MIDVSFEALYRRDLDTRLRVDATSHYERKRDHWRLTPERYSWGALRGFAIYLNGRRMWFKANLALALDYVRRNA